MTQIDSAKVGGYTVVGPDDNIKAAAKISGYAVVGPDDNINAAAKISGYAVIRPLNSIDVIKTIGYAVVAEIPVIPQNSLTIQAGIKFTGGITIKIN